MRAAVISMLDQALAYIELGLLVFPLWEARDGGCACPNGVRCENPGKHPCGALVPHGLKDASGDADQVRRWWQMRPDANIGVKTGAASGVTVLDLDGNEGLASGAALRLDDIPTWVSQTGRGQHWWFRHPGVPVANRVKVKPGLDVRGDGGYVVAPPSLHASGKLYEWIEGRAPWECTLAELPAHVLVLLLPSAPASRNGNASATQVEPIPEGQRNDLLYRLGRGLKLKGMSPAAIGGALREENQTRCDPPLPDLEIDALIHQVLEQPDKPGGLAVVEAFRRAEPPAPLGPDEQDRAWPKLADEALYGLAGDVVRALAPFTEADPVSVLGHFLGSAGNILGPNPHAVVGETRHPLRLNTAFVGATSRGRKGTAWGLAYSVLARVDEAWARGRVRSGLSSGEGLIFHVRDAHQERIPVKEKGRVVDYEWVETDAGEADKRLLVIEPEFAVVLKRMAVDGNSVSGVIRQAWDSGDLATLTKVDPLRATGAHISILAHITEEELRRYLTETERGNGFANRFLFFLVRRSQLLPEAPPCPPEVIDELTKRVREAVTFAASVEVLRRDDEAKQMWKAVYAALTADRGGMVGAIISRAEAQVLRLSALYAVLDRSRVIRAPHLKAALGVWEYAEASVIRIFGERTGNPVADRILLALRERGPLTRTDISSLFNRNRRASEIDAALLSLEASRLAAQLSQEAAGAGRPAEMWGSL